ncbi:hypothetical protein LIER_35501 [Lithospermum erythrorhizon]|uniref:Uncharacterized protein n=1 Tax=Lithospermum erythrorhizon TaxID=34254 RepID=A0AAV3NVJ4_LITER
MLSCVEFKVEDGDNSGQDVEDYGGEGVARLDCQVVGEMPRDVLPREEGAILVEFGGYKEKDSVTEIDLDQSWLLGDATQNVEEKKGSCTITHAADLDKETTNVAVEKLGQSGPTHTGELAQAVKFFKFQMVQGPLMLLKSSPLRGYRSDQEVGWGRQ